jgi:transposase
MPRKRVSYSKEKKFQIALALIKGDKTMTELMQEHKVSQSVLHKWKKQLIDRGSEIFDGKGKHHEDNTAEVANLQRKIGELTMELDFLKKVSGSLM